ncbi:MAG: hypothetical protein OEY52_01800 [Gammaproteobacteria bacterium]|nr:hypothetical protein [Gammaproteobacteria bacterium]
MNYFFKIHIILSLILASSQIIAEPLTTRAIDLNYRQAEDVVSLLKPFLHPQGVMTADGYKILIKTSDNNYKDLLQLVAEIDVSLRQLKVSVTLDSELARLQNQLESSGQDNKLQDGSASREVTTEVRNLSGKIQHVSVLEGKWANLSTGESIPVGQRIRNPDGTVTESITYKSINSSIQILPRITGEKVMLFIRPQQNTLSGISGKTRLQSAETTMSGKLNQWVSVGGISQVEVNQPGSRIYSTQKSPETSNQIYVKVEIIP